LDQQWYNEALAALASYPPFQNLGKDDQHSCAVEIMLIVSSTYAMNLFYRLQKLPFPELPKGNDDGFKRILVSDFADELEYNNRSHLPQIKKANPEKSAKFELFADPAYAKILMLDFHPLHKPCINPHTTVNIQKWIREFYLVDDKLLAFDTLDVGRSINRVQLECLAAEYSNVKKCVFWYTKHVEFGAIVAKNTGTAKGKYEDTLEAFARSAGATNLDVEKTSQNLKELKELGFNDEQVLDCISIVSAFAFYTRIVDATGHKLPPNNPNQG